MQDFAALQDRIDRHSFINGYIRAMLWANTIQTVRDRNGDEGYESYDARDDRHLLTLDALKELTRDALDFRRSQYAYLLAASEYKSWGELGELFALSRNGHGAGYFDSGLPEADALQSAARAWGEATLELINGRLEAL